MVVKKSEAGSPAPLPGGSHPGGNRGQMEGPHFVLAAGSGLPLRGPAAKIPNISVRMLTQLLRELEDDAWRGVRLLVHLRDHRADREEI